MKKFLYFISVFFVFLFNSCNRNKEISLDLSEPLALAPDVEWAVVIDPYAAYRSDTDWSSEVMGHCRKGDILQIKGTSVFNNSENWYFFDSGWLPESALHVYSNRFKAETAAGKLR